MTKASPRQWKLSYSVRQVNRWAVSEFIGCIEVLPNPLALAHHVAEWIVEAATAAQGSFQSLALGWVHAEDTLWTSGFGRIQASFPLAAGVLVLGRRAFRPVRSPRKQFSDGPRSHARQSPGAAREHSSHTDRRDPRRRGSPLRTDTAAGLWWGDSRSTSAALRCDTARLGSRWPYRLAAAGRASPKRA